MVDSIGRMPMGKTLIVGRHRRRIVNKAKKKMQTWRDKARLNLLQQRRRLKLKVARNAKSMDDRKKDREKNPNPLAFSTMPESKKLLKYSASYSTIPAKPKYSQVKPRERVYGNKWSRFEGRKK